MGKRTIHVILETTSPMHNAFPDNSVKTKDGNRIALTNKKQVKGVDVPCFPANGFRGALRRKAGQRIVQKFSDTEARIDAKVYRGIMCGAATGRPDKSANSIEELARASEHAYMGLFGGGSRIFASAYQVSDLNVICNHTVSTGCVHAPKSLIEEIVLSQTYEKEGVDVPIQPFQFVEEHFFTRVNDFGRKNDWIALDKVIKDGLAGVAELISNDVDNSSKRKSQESNENNVKKEDTSTLLSNQAIKTGTPLHFRIDLSPNASDAQIGLLLIALKDVFEENYIGGWGRVGWGRYRVTAFDFTLDDERFIKTESFYSEQEDFILPKETEHLVDAGLNAIACMDCAEMIDFFTPLTKEK